MNIKSKDFLKRIELGEKKSEKLYLMSLTLGVVSILLALQKSLVQIAKTYGILIALISLISLMITLKEENFYKKIGEYNKDIKLKIIINSSIDFLILLFGILLLFFPKFF